MNECPTEYCREHFETLNRRIDQKARLMEEHDRSIIRIDTQIENLLRSMAGLTRALWGAAAAVMTTLVGFLVWYIQTH